jgi:hypothetical protein
MGFSCSSLKVKQIFCFVFHFKMVTGEVKRDQVYGINEESSGMLDLDIYLQQPCM